MSIASIRTAATMIAETGLAGLMMIALAGMSSGCALIPDRAPVTLLEPMPAAPEPSDQPPASWSLQIARPVADQLRDSRQVLVRRGDSTLQVYSQARWIDNVPELLRTLVVRHLADGGRVSDVHATGVPSDLMLAMDIRHFEVVDDSDDTRRVEVAISARLLDGRSGALIEARSFRARADLDRVDSPGIVGGFERALDRILPELADWLSAAGSNVGSAEASVR